jgi:branched-subunit amino acid ABC-type transport system permease component
MTTAVLTLVFAAELALVAVSFNLSYRVSGFANFAHVQYVTVGAYIAWELNRGSPLVIAIIGGVIGGGLVAVALNLCVFRWLRSASVGTKMVASAGAALALVGLIQYLWGVSAQSFGFTPSLYTLFGARVTLLQLLIIVIAAVTITGLALALKATRSGRNVRAVADNTHLAETRGLNTGLVLNQVWLVSGALAGLAGTLISLNTFVRPELGASLLIPMFAAAIVGGIGSPFGAVVGALLVATAETLVVTVDFGELFGGESHYLGSEYKAVVAFVLLIGILIVKPSGFFGVKEVRA